MLKILTKDKNTMIWALFTPTVLSTKGLLFCIITKTLTISFRNI